MDVFISGLVKKHEPYLQNQERQNDHNQNQLEQQKDESYKQQENSHQKSSQFLHQHQHQPQQDTIQVLQHLKNDINKNKEEENLQNLQLESVQNQQVQEVIEFQNNAKKISIQDIFKNNDIQSSPIEQFENLENPFGKFIGNTSSQPNLSSNSKENEQHKFDSKYNAEFNSSQKYSNQDQDNNNNNLIMNYLPKANRFSNHLEEAEILQSKQYNHDFDLNNSQEKEQPNLELENQNHQNNSYPEQRQQRNYLSNVNSNSPMILSNTRNQICFPQLKKNYQTNFTQIKRSLFMMRSQHKQFYQKFKCERLEFQQGLIFAQDEILKQIKFYIQKQKSKKSKSLGLNDGNSQNLQEKLKRRQREFQIQKKLIKQQYQQKLLFLKQKNFKLEQELSLINQRKRKQNKQQEYQNGQDFKSVKELQLMTAQLQLELHQKNLILEELQKENENLSEHVFDIQQQIAGFQLQVEKKVQQELLKLKKSGAINLNFVINQNHPELQQQKLNTITEQSQLQFQQSINIMTMNNNNNNNNSYHMSNSYQKNGNAHNNYYEMQKIQLQQLSKQLESLTKKCQFLQLQKKNKENHYLERQKIIRVKEMELEKGEEDLNYEWTELDKEIHRNKLRETQLQLAQENISKKISELRLRQSQFVERQRELEDKWKLFEKQKSKIQKIQKSLSLRQEQLDRRSSLNFEQPSINNLSNQLRSPIGIYDLNSRKDQFPQIPELPIKGSKNQPERDYEARYSNIDGNSISMKYRPDKIYEKVYHKNSNNNLQKDSNYDSDKFQRQRERVSYQTGSNYRTGKNVGHQYVLPQSPNKRSRSKSRSHQKNIKPLYGSHLQGQVMSNYKMVGNYKQQIREPSSNFNSSYQKGGNISGLGSKLQRLRDQIKKQIDSIK